MTSLDFTRLARRLTFVLFLAQSLASAGFIAASTLNPILGAQLGGSSAWAGVPSAVYLLAGAFAASVWGTLMDRIGRRGGIAAGLAFGAIGAVLVILAINAGALPLFLLGMVFMGIANAAVVLGRFAAAEVHPPEQRGAAISNVVLGGTVGAVFGPWLVGPMGKLVATIGMDELVGAYVAGLILFAVAAISVFLGLRPDPRDVGRSMADAFPASAPHGAARPIGEILRQPASQVAIVAMVAGQMVMVAIMVITALYMKRNNHALGDIAAVISAHTIGMYAFSVLSGRLVDKWGRGRAILAGAGTLLLATLTAPLSPNVLPLAVSLFLLGLGWNFCFVGGSALLANHLSPAERARTQGVNDLFVGLASAVASLGSGFVFAASSYTIISLAAGVLSLVPMWMTFTWMRLPV